jgi:cupin fold WbuC family metalloprotein
MIVMTAKVVNKNLLRELSQQAAFNPRLRINYNLHDSLDEPCQRVINAMEPGSYIRPHRHFLVPKPELFVPITGKVVLIFFSDSGEIEQSFVLGGDSQVRAVDVPVGVWHTAISLEKGSVFLEVKPGPFVPLDVNDFAQWAPAPETQEVALYMQNIEDEWRYHE